MRFKPNNRGFYDVRRMPKLIDMLEHEAETIAGKANAELGEEGFATGSRQGARRPQGRWRTSVYTRTAHAMRHNAKHNTLLKKLHGG
jgi:hypothetical protein